jgi:hypothetical protein
MRRGLLLALIALVAVPAADARDATRRLGTWLRR